MAFLQVGADASLQGPAHKPGYFFGVIKSIDEKPSKNDTTKHVLHVTIVPDPSFGLQNGTTARFYIAQGTDGRFNESNVLRVAAAAWRQPIEQARARLMAGVDTSVLVNATIFYSVTIEPKKEGDKYDNTIVLPLVDTEIREAVAKNHYPQNVLGSLGGGGGGGATAGSFQGPPGQGQPNGFGGGQPGGFPPNGGGGFQGQGQPNGGGFPPNGGQPNFGGATG